MSGSKVRLIVFITTSMHAIIAVVIRQTARRLTTIYYNNVSQPVWALKPSPWAAEETAVWPEYIQAARTWVHSSPNCAFWLRAAEWLHDRSQTFVSPSTQDSCKMRGRYRRAECRAHLWSGSVYQCQSQVAHMYRHTIPEVNCTVILIYVYAGGISQTAVRQCISLV